MVFLHAWEKEVVIAISYLWYFYALHILARSVVYQLLIAIIYTCITFVANFDAQFVWFAEHAKDNRYWMLRTSVLDGICLWFPVFSWYWYTMLLTVAPAGQLLVSYARLRFVEMTITIRESVVITRETTSEVMRYVAWIIVIFP